MGEWISVKDRLPEWLEDEQSYAVVLACFKTDLGESGVWLLQVRLAAEFGKSGYQWMYADGSLFPYTVTHWQPLPEPPFG